MKLWEILVPASNSKRKENFTYEHHKAWDEFVKSISGGLSISGTIKGEWLNVDGILFKDRLIPVRIRCGSDDIEKIAEFTVTHYNQEAVFYYLVSDDCRIKYRSTD